MQQFDLSALPGILQPEIANWLESNAGLPLIAAVIEASAGVRTALPRVIASSTYVAGTLARYPELLRELLDSGRLDRPLRGGELDELCAAELAAEQSETEFQRRLRLLRHRELVRIVWRDQVRAASLDETLDELSALADAAICSALSWATAELAPHYGTPRGGDGEVAEFGVLAMGKLGGRELNFSSDVDLVFVYSDQGETTGARSVSNEEYFRLLGQRIVGLLSKNTADGFVYRVDVRLRPFGESGPLAVSAAALENYLLQHGRDWERYAYIKARVVNEWRDASSLYEDVLRPFIYRRYLDYGVFDSLRDMKALIEAEVQRKEFRDNLKLGPGGIREIEFIVQSLQLVRGGTTEDLRQRELMAVLPALAQHQCLPAQVADELGDAYRFLRRLENRLQAIADRQTHDLPANDIDRARLSLAMHFGSWAELEGTLARHRDCVSGHFRNIVFRGTGEPESSGDDGALARAWCNGVPAATFEPLLRNAGFPEPQAVLQRLQGIRDGSNYRRMDESGRQRLDTLIPAVLAEAAKQANPLQSLEGVIVVIDAIGRRSAYFALLNENPVALERLVSLCGMSEFLARQVATHPLLLDELLDQRVFVDAPGRADFATDLASRMAAGEDVEQRLDAVRNFQQAAIFRVAVADLSGTLPLMKVSDRLTDVAELVLQAALDLSWTGLTAQHGAPRCRLPSGERDAEFAIIAYGKLGGLELGYGSDLDLVFLHNSEGEDQQTSGPKPVENGVFFARLTRRVIHVLTMTTTSGPLYEVDTRLRPSGRSGLLVSSLAAFDRYQRESAWTWEHQALLRSRAVAGSPAVRSAFETLRQRALTTYVNRRSLRADVLDMRQRMRDELCAGTPEQFDLKQDAGGITDIEFIVQFLVLHSAAEFPALIAYSDNIRQLEALADYGILDRETERRLADIYREYRRRMHHLALAGAPALVPRAEVQEPAQQVSEIWSSVLG